MKLTAWETTVLTSVASGCDPYRYHGNTRTVSQALGRLMRKGALNRSADEAHKGTAGYKLTAAGWSAWRGPVAKED